MSERAITKLWGFFALILLSFSFLCFLRSTGMDPKGEAFGILGYKATTIPALALPVDYFLMSVFLWLSVLWSRQVGGATWAHRQPVFHFEKADVDPGTQGGRLYQGWAFFLTMVVPLLTTLQMTARFFGGTIYANCECIKSGQCPACLLLCGKTGGTAQIANAWEQFDFTRLATVHPMLRYGDVNGPQFFPALPWVYAVWGLCVLAIWLLAAWSILRGPSKEWTSV